MAIALQGYRGYMTLVDNGGNETTKTFQLREATDFELAHSAMLSIVTALTALTNAKVKTWGTTRVMAEEALVLPASGVQIEDQALLTVTIDGKPNKSATLTVPAPIPAVFVDTSGEGANVVNTAWATLNTYVNCFKSTGQAFISDGEDVGALFKGRRIHRKSRRG